MAQTTTSTDKNVARKSGEGESLLEKFFLDQLKDIYYAEQLLVKTIPKMQEAATTEELREAFEDHLHQTNKQVKRISHLNLAHEDSPSNEPW